jgi:anti-sigma regulatory factor (Ser/Thr protein kinase)
MTPPVTVELRDPASVSVVRELVRQLAREAGLDAVEAEHCAAAASELGHNVLRHALRGRMRLRVLTRDGVAGVEAEALDVGPGIAQPGEAVGGQGAARSAGLGIGLGSVLRLCHEVDLDSRVGEGTRILARRFGARLRRLPEVGVYGRPFPGYAQSGDQAWFRREGEQLVLAVCDGLGHGPEAADAAQAALSALDDAPVGVDLVDLLSAAHHRAQGTRGAALTVARWDGRQAWLAGMGNVLGEVVGGEGSLQRFSPTPGVVGVGRFPGVRVTRLDGGLEASFALFTDGVQQRGRGAIRRGAAEHPVLLAEELVTRQGRLTDDALALVSW